MTPPDRVGNPPDQAATAPDTVVDALERLEWRDRALGAGFLRAQATRRTALTGAAAGLAATLLAACGDSAGTGSAGSRTGADAIFGVRGGYRFTFVNHLMTDPFFTPTRNGAADACALLDCSYEWTGSASNSVSQMVSAINTAVSAGVDGIATPLIVRGAFRLPIAGAVRAGIPVVAYNADERGTDRLAYVGQDLFRCGLEMGVRISELIPDGGRIMVFIATPGSGNLQPRLDGLREALRGTNIQLHSEATGTSQSEELATIDACIATSLTAYRGYFAVDAGSTEALARAFQRYGAQLPGVSAGGVDLTPVTQQLLREGIIDFTIDQQPYMQGFLPVLELFLHRASRGLTGVGDVDTGIRFMNRATIAAATRTASRYEGTATTPGVASST